MSAVRFDDLRYVCTIWVSFETIHLDQRRWHGVDHWWCLANMVNFQAWGTSLVVSFTAWDREMATRTLNLEKGPTYHQVAGLSSDEAKWHAAIENDLCWNQTWAPVKANTPSSSISLIHCYNLRICRRKGHCPFTSSSAQSHQPSLLRGKQECCSLVICRALEAFQRKSSTKD